jgi:Leucine-rich repeat (LRR) protein
VARETPDRRSLARRARRLLEWLSRPYVERVQSLAGFRHMHWPEGLIEDEFDSWSDELEHAPEALRTPAALRAIVEEALVEAQLRCVERLEPSLGRTRATEIYRDFAQTLNRERFANPHGHTYRTWVDAALPLPEPPPGLTPDDQRLRERIATLSEEQRRSLPELVVDDVATQLRDLSPLAELRGLRKLHICNATMLGDLSPLARLTTLEELVIDSPEVRDIAPLAGLTALRRLTLESTRVRDLDPLVTMQSLEQLSVSGSSGVESLDPLASIPTLSHLKLYKTGIRDLEPLTHLPALRELTLASCRELKDLSLLGRLHSLRVLDLHEASLQSLDVVRPLTALVALMATFNRELFDISAVAELQLLEILDLGGCPFRDPTPLGRLTNLRELKLFGSCLQAVPPLAHLPRLAELDLTVSEIPTLAGIEQARALRELHFGSRTVRDLSPLASVTTLERLHIDVLAVTDLSPLRQLTHLTTLTLSSDSLRDLAPLAALKALTTLDLASPEIESVEPLSHLPELRHLDVNGCPSLKTLLPLASCPKLERIECRACHELRGPRSLNELRTPKKPPPKTFPSAGPTPARDGQVCGFDARNHLPRRPPERWSVPERRPGDPRHCVLEADGVRVAVVLLADGEDHLLMVYLAPRSDLALTDKQAARILRRFRSCNAFVETHYEDALFGLGPTVRCFIARALPASPDTWGAVREGHALIRVEAPEEHLPRVPARSDIGLHLPAPLPDGWSLRKPVAPEDTACRLTAPEADIVVTLRTAEGSDVPELVVGLFPTPGGPLYVGDAAAHTLLACFGARGAFEECIAGPYAAAPGMRLFVAAIR